MILLVAIILRIVFSYTSMDPGNPLVTIVHDVTEPILAPIRQVIPRLGMFDFSPMIASFILLIIIRAAMSLN